MRVNGGHTIEVWRSTRDRFGDKASEEKVGEIANVLLDWHTPQASGEFQETATQSPVMFIPRDAAVTVQQRDRIKLDGVTYAVVGQPMWRHDHPFTGFRFSHYQVQVEATT